MLGNPLKLERKKENSSQNSIDFFFFNQFLKFDKEKFKIYKIKLL